jgi:GxxExxY protein
MEEDLKFSDLTRIIIGDAMKVHSYLGMGFPEKIYQRCLIIALKDSGLSFEVEVDRPIRFKGKTVGKRRLDLIVEQKILIELKAVSELDKSCYNQILNYLKIFGLEIGLLINFGKDSLEFKRLIYSGKHSRNPF